MHWNGRSPLHATLNGISCKNTIQTWFSSENEFFWLLLKFYCEYSSRTQKIRSLPRIFYRQISTLRFNLDSVLYFKETSELKSPQWIENEPNIMHCKAKKRRNNGMTSNIEFSQQCSCMDAITRERCSAHANSIHIDESIVYSRALI